MVSKDIFSENHHGLLKPDYSIFSQSPDTDTERVLRIINAALDAADPQRAVEDHLKYNGKLLEIEGHVYNLEQYRKVVVVGFGKAVIPMTLGLVNVIGDRLSAGVIITKQFFEKQAAQLPKHIQILPGNHPIPGTDSLNSTRQLVALIHECHADDLVFCLVSGGGSALFTLPADGIELADLQKITNQLLYCGANITEINVIRKRLDEVKGGGLARLAYPARMITLILSDVVGDAMDIIASGPTIDDKEEPDLAKQVITKYHLENHISLRIAKFLEIQRVIKHLEPLQVHNVVVASNQKASLAAIDAAKKEGFNALLLSTFLEGEASQAGLFLARILRQVDATGHPIKRPACLIMGGETTVTIDGNRKKNSSLNRGGRNQELALGAMASLAGIHNVALISMATDGEDGLTDAAGAIVTGETLSNAGQLGLNPQDYLNNHDSYHFFEKLNGLVKTGTTGTNVNDLVFLFAF